MLAGLAAIVISSPVAGAGPLALLLRQLHAYGQLHDPHDPYRLLRGRPLAKGRERGATRDR